METHEIAVRLARQCREIIQTCLREEEWLDAEEEFRWVILAGLNEVAAREKITSPNASVVRANGSRPCSHARKP
jgi:hypothetical protein